MIVDCELRTGVIDAEALQEHRLGDLSLSSTRSQLGIVTLPGEAQVLLCLKDEMEGRNSIETW